MSIFIELLKLSIMFLVFVYLFGILITKLLQYNAKKLKVRDEKILLDREWSNLNKIELQVKEKELMKKITKCSFIEMIFFIALVVTFWYCYIAIQNNDNSIFEIIVLVLESITLIVFGVIKFILKRERYKCLTLIDKKKRIILKCKKKIKI